MWVLYVIEDPTEGFSLYGMFDSPEEAVEWGSGELKNSTWYVVRVHDKEE